MIRFAVEPLPDALDEMIPLVQQDYDEMEPNSPIKLSPNYEIYQKLHELDLVFLATARDDDQLVGYFLASVTAHLHHKDDLFCLSDIIWLSPKYRNKSVGLNLFKFVEQQMIERGVEMIVVDTKTRFPLGRLMNKLGYESSEIRFTKYIGDQTWP